MDDSTTQPQPTLPPQLPTETPVAPAVEPQPVMSQPSVASAPAVAVTPPPAGGPADQPQPQPVMPVGMPNNLTAVTDAQVASAAVPPAAGAPTATIVQTPSSISWLKTPSGYVERPVTIPPDILLNAVKPPHVEEAPPDTVYLERPLIDPENLKRLLIPSAWQMTVCLLITIGLFGLVHHDLIAAKFLTNSILNNEYLRQGAQQELAKAASLNAVSLGVKIVFWSGVGLISYIIFLAITNAIIEGRNEVMIETEYTNKGAVKIRWRRPLIQVGSALGLVALMLIATYLVYPIWLGQFQLFVGTFPSTTSFLYLAESLAGSVATIYVIWTLGQIVFEIS